MLVLSFPEFDVIHWMSHWKWFSNSLSDIHTQFLKKLHANENLYISPHNHPQVGDYLKSKFETFFSIWFFFHGHSLITGLQGKEDDISLTLHYHFQPLHRHLGIRRKITAENSPLHKASRRNQISAFNSSTQL